MVYFGVRMGCAVNSVNRPVAVDVVNQVVGHDGRRCRSVVDRTEIQPVKGGSGR